MWKTTGNITIPKSSCSVRTRGSTTCWPGRWQTSKRPKESSQPHPNIEPHSLSLLLLESGTANCQADSLYKYGLQLSFCCKMCCNNGVMKSILNSDNAATAILCRVPLKNWTPFVRIGLQFTMPSNAHTHLGLSIFLT